jgi:hypothetical protein
LERRSRLLRLLAAALVASGVTVVLASATAERTARAAPTTLVVQVRW